MLLETAVANVVAVKIFDAGGELMMLGPNNPYGSTPARGSAEGCLAELGMRVGTMCLYKGASAQFERERDWNCSGGVQAQLTVDQTVSTVPARVTKVGQVALFKVGKLQSDYF